MLASHQNSPSSAKARVSSDLILALTSFHLAELNEYNNHTHLLTPIMSGKYVHTYMHLNYSYYIYIRTYVRT